PDRLDPPQARAARPPHAPGHGRVALIRRQRRARPTGPGDHVMDPVKPRPDRVNSVVPTWIRGSTNLLAMVVTAGLAALLVVLIGWLSPVLAPLGLGMFLAALAAPLFSRLAERGYSPPV